MQWTPWQSANKVELVEPDEIEFEEWTRSGSITVEPIGSVATSTGGYVRDESSALAFTEFDFGIPSEKVREVEVEIHISRLARVQDKKIALWQGSVVSDNKADLEAEDRNVYKFKKWGEKCGKKVTKLDVDFTSPDFGVYIDYQPHETIPSRETVYLRSVKMRLGYVI